MVVELPNDERAQVRPAIRADIPAMVDLLHTKMNPKFSRKRWERLFNAPWMQDAPDFGRVAVMGDDIVGCCVAIYSVRRVHGRAVSIVNPCAWYLDKRARGSGVGRALMADVTADPDRHYHICTSSQKTVDLLAAIGFSPLDTHKVMWRGAPDIQAHAEPQLHLLSPDAEFTQGISDETAKALADHDGTYGISRAFELEGAFAQHGPLVVIGRDCRKASDARWFDVLYASNAQHLGAYGQMIANTLSAEAGEVITLAADERLTHGAKANDRVALDPPRFWKSDGTVPQSAVDHLYSEIPLLGLKLG